MQTRMANMKPQRRTIIQLPIDDEKWSELVKARKSLSHSLSEIASATQEILAPLSTLTKEQKDAVFMLGLLIREVSMAIQPPAGLSAKVLNHLRSALNDSFKPMGTIVASNDPCLKATFEYAAASQRCQDEGCSDAQCFESWGPAASVIRCRIKEIELMRNVIASVLSRRSPPTPVPWSVRTVLRSYKVQ